MLDTLLDKNFVLYYLNIETFPLAQKVPKLQKLLNARRLYHRGITTCLPCKGIFAFGHYGSQDSELSGGDAIAQRLMEWERERLLPLSLKLV